MKSAFTGRPASLWFQTKSGVQDISAWGEAFDMRAGVSVVRVGAGPGKDGGTWAG